MHLSQIEPLETRIAPALLVAGANLLGGAGNPTTGEASIEDTSVTLVKVLSGQAVVWFDGINITGISFGPNTTLDITGNVFGSIVGNLTSAGLLSDSDNNPANGEDGGLLLSNNLLGLTTREVGNQDGDIDHVITGGSIANVKIAGAAQGIYAGDGVYRAESLIGNTNTVAVDVSIDVNPVLPGIQTGFTLDGANASFLGGASITNVSVTTAQSLQVFSGNGDPTGSGSATAAGVAGGNITGVKIKTAFLGGASFSYEIIAGSGGNGSTGGAGGSVKNVIENQSAVQASVTAGSGGTGLVGVGGAGGNISGLDLQGGNTSYSVLAGSGGNGASGGAGGSITSGNFSGQQPNSGLVVTGDFTGDNFEDVIVIDTGTGKFTVTRNPGSSGAFVPIVQHGGADPALVDSLGATPSDAVAGDVDGDGDLDLIISYANSNNVAVYFNQAEDGAASAGVFYEPGDVLAATSFDVGVSPTRIALGDFADTGALDVAVFSVAGAQTSAAVFIGDNTGTFTRGLGTTLFEGVLADLAVANNPVGPDLIFVGATNGALATLSPATGNNSGPFIINEANAAITNGVQSIDVDFEFQRVIVLSRGGVGVGQNLYAFNVSPNRSLELESVSAANATGPANILDARFVNDLDHDSFDNVILMASLDGNRGTEFLSYTTLPTTGPENEEIVSYQPGEAVAVADVLKTFDMVNQILTTDYADGRKEQATLGVAALAGSINKFAFVSSDLANPVGTLLPFAPKAVNLTAGDGGNGTSLTGGKGGAGGKLSAINLESVSGNLVAGNGGTSATGAAGAGGSVSNPASFVSASGITFLPKLKVDSTVLVAGGAGGANLGAGKGASGGAGGAVSSLNVVVAGGFSGDGAFLTAGNGGTAAVGKGGVGGAASKIKVDVFDAGLTISTGNGGSSAAGAFAGGAGGALSSITFKMDRPISLEKTEHPNEVILSTGSGGSSAGGAGGAGGAVSAVSLTFDSAEDSSGDGTIISSVTTGNGGNGTKGGAGGSIQSFRTTSLHDNVLDDGTITPTRAVLSMITGNGGIGSAGDGGAGGSIILGGANSLAGLTGYDSNALTPTFPLILVTGDGAQGSARGGAGGNITGVVAKNSATPTSSTTSDVLVGTDLDGAFLATGAGGNGGTGDGGKGGDVTATKIGVFFAQLIVAGAGGDGGTAGGAAAAKAKGGNGGSVTTSFFGSVATTASNAIQIVGGAAGDGVAAGGIGGILSGLNINSAARSTGRAADLIAGAGGDASGVGGIGGRGGDILKITQTKDLNSSLDLLLAGNGGAAAAGTGGKGGDVRDIRVAGYIGKPSASTPVLQGDPGDPPSPPFDEKLGVFQLTRIDADSDPITTPVIESYSVQGLFTGRGGIGGTVGKSGAVANVTARGIAAIAAAPSAIMGDGSTPILFAPASSVTNVKAQTIGYDIDGDGECDDGTNTPINSPASPGTVMPADGFIFATTIAGVIVNGGPADPDFVFNS